MHERDSKSDLKTTRYLFYGKTLLFPEKERESIAPMANANGKREFDQFAEQRSQRALVRTMQTTEKIAGIFCTRNMTLD
jgi:uncharacterized membrane protein